MMDKMAFDTQPKAAEPRVVGLHQEVLQQLPFEDMQDFEDAGRGFVATIPDAELVNPKTGGVAWSMKPYGFQDREEAPLTVNPSLWRQARLNKLHGLFEVVPGVYQIRGFDLANMTLVEGQTGVIVIDCTTTIEAATAGLKLYREHRGDRPVTAVIYTHSHADHWGGALGVISPEDAASGRVPVIVPDRFVETAISEYIIAGNAMDRRAHYQFGTILPPGERLQVDTGLGKTRSAGGTTSYIRPNDAVKETGETRVLDGVEFVFQMAPNTEAPAEFHIYLPAQKVLNLAENAVHVFHNLLPFRGTQARNSFDWSRYINEAVLLWGKEAEVLVGQHHWPVWGNERVRTYLSQQRDLYKYVHDQTLRLANHGLKPAEIAETIRLPASLDRLWHLRGYYGSLRHNAKAIYQFYLGWYDANPANLDPLPPVETGRKMMEYMGGAAAVIARARQDFQRGEYRFVAQVMSHVVFADQDNVEARHLLADAFEQLGYIAECATWRNAYLFGAYELRNGSPPAPFRTPLNPQVLAAMNTDQLFDYLAVRLDGLKADGRHLVLNWRFGDTGEEYAMNVENGALTYTAGHQAAEANLTLTLPRTTWNDVLQGRTSYRQAIDDGQIGTEGDVAVLFDLLGMLDEFPRMFEIVEPLRAR
jgi:alkyl sulfatase BDS1-like metallo-beta-lactamase superfamily hydrolase